MYITNNTTMEEVAIENQGSPGMMEAALEYAAMGLAIFPIWSVNADGSCKCGKPVCDSPGKHPITRLGKDEATTRSAQIKVWWTRHPSANIGSPTGEKNGIVVLDCDGQDGLERAAQLRLPETLSVTTGRIGGGTHFWFKHSGRPVKNKVNLLPGLDVRGDGGYVILPPSLHQSGNRYHWDRPEGFSYDTIVEQPESLTKLLQEPAKKDPLRFTPIIPSGQRNDTLFREGSKLRGLGWDVEAIFEALSARNDTACSPPLSSEEVRQIAEQAGNYNPNPILQTFRNTDVGNAQRLVALYGDDIRYNHEQKAWYFWDGRRWRRDRSGRVRLLAQRTISETHELAIRLANRDLETWALETEKKNGIARMMVEAQPQSGITISMNDLDRNTWLLNVLNGTLNLETGEWLEHNPSDLIANLAPVEYDPEAECPSWEHFIWEVFAGDVELIGYVQRVCGYMLSGDTREEALFVAHGGGANGKSTLLNTIRKLLGDYGATTPFSTFDADNRNQYGNDLAALKGKRGVVAIEAEQEKRIAEARVKTITGRDSISCRFLYGEFFEYEPTYKVWLAVNHKPVIRGAERGIWRRIKLIPFDVNFEAVADKVLDQKLAAEFPGILNWMLEGLREWQQRGGLDEPQAVKLATEDYRRESDTLGEWLTDRCDLMPEGVTPASELYQDYRKWSEEQGESRYILSQRTFSIQLGERGFTRQRVTRGSQWLGITLIPQRVFAAQGL